MRAMLSRRSLRQLLPVLFFLLAAIPAGAIGVLLTQRAWQRELQTVHEQHLQLAQHLAEALAHYAKNVEAVFRLTASNVAANFPVQELATLLEHLHFQYVCIVDGAGRAERLFAPNPDFKAERIPAPLLETVRAAAAGTAPSSVFISHVLPDSRGNPALFLWQPLGEDRYAFGALKTEYFVQLQNTISFGKRGHAAIVDRSGHIMAHPDLQWRATMRDISQLEPVRRMMAGETGVSRFFSPAMQADMIAGFTTIPRTGWGVMIPQPLAELAAHVGQVQRAVWFVIGVALLGATLLGWLVSQWLAAPLQRIGAVAAQFASGAYEARVSDLGVLCTHETTTLAAQFNAMADEVNRSWQAQQASEQRCREFAEIAADWFWETDLQQVFTYTSPSSDTKQYWNSAALLGQHRRKHVLGDPDGKVVALIQSYMDRELQFDNVMYQVLGNDGHPLHLAVSGRPIRQAEGQVVGYRGVAHDTTARLRAEAHLRQAQRAEQLRHAQKMEAIGTLAGGIAHDFNNILAAILGYTELTLHEVPQDSLARSHLQRVLTAGSRARDLVQQILTFGRKREPEPKPLHLHTIVKEALQLLRASLPATIAMRQDLAEDAGMVLADPTQMHQVLVNLCANAEHAMRHTDGVLEVQLDAVELDATCTDQYPTLHPGPHVRLTVRDTGHGMTPEVMGRIFEPFFTTKDVGQGTGMGLAVVHGIVTSHNGAITVQSAPEQGTTFVIYLPRVAATSSAVVPQAEPVLTGKGCILFVDDEDAIALWGQELLTQLGYEVVVNTSSLEALAIFQAAPEHFDLVITDQTMPHMTGEILAAKLQDIRPDIPIILCTGFSHSIDAEKAAAQGIDAFLMKPLLARDLGVAIQQVLAHRAVQGSA
ncbi:MAG TPA: ATP-binding protein [Candidatus Tectomicrobia bacterium]|jgi:PAS domain S-box-containing protein